MQNFRGGVQGYPSIDRPWKKYYSDVSVDESRVGRTVYQYVVENNIDYMDTNAISYKGKEITYGTMIDYADQVAESLLRYGIKTGDRIMMAATGCPKLFTSCLLAVSLAFVLR